MKYRLHKLLALIATVALLCVLLPMGAMAREAQPADLMRLVGVCYAEKHAGKVNGTAMTVSALAFRFRIDAAGLNHIRHETDTSNATVNFGGETYKLERFGLLTTNQEAVGNNPNMMVLENADQKSVTDIPARVMFSVDKNHGEYVSRIINIPADKEKNFDRTDTLIYARPYFVYKNSSNEEITAYGGIESANASGKKIRYATELGSMGWAAETDGVDQSGTNEVGTAFINSTDLLIRLPEQQDGTPTAYVRADYYSADSFLSSVDVKDNWTVLGDLGVPTDAVGVRLVAYAADGSAVSDVEAFGNSIRVTSNKRQNFVPLSFLSGGLSEKDGAELEDASYTRTNYLSVRDVLVKPEGNVAFKPFFYDSDKQFISCGSFFMTRAKKVLDMAPASAAYVRFLLTEKETESDEGLTPASDNSTVPFGLAQFFAYTAGSDPYHDFEDEANEEETEPTVPTDPTGSTTSSTTTKPTTGTTTKPVGPDEPLILTADVPENQGVQNALWNMQQMVKISYTPLKTLPRKTLDCPVGVTQKGLPYSSSRVEQAYVPSNISFHTFMTALQNPNSYLYTVDLDRDYGNINGKTYYGTVCSTTCAYALGIVPNYTTYQWTEIPGMSKLENQDLQELKLCDTIVGQGHVAMITGITRDQHGNIVKVNVSQAAGIDTHTGDYTITALEERFPANLYEYCRYTNLESVTYTPSEYVAVGNETAQSVTYNTTIIPRKGDESNWRSSETVVLDVLKTDGYTGVEIYRWVSDAWQLEKTLPVTSVVELKGLKAGTYRARLVGSKKDSPYCKWIVTNVTSKGELYQGTRQVKVSFSASGNAEPLYVQWINSTSNATVRITVLTDAQKEAGYGIFKPARALLKVRVAFKTNYGIIYAELPAEALNVQ